MIYIRITNTSTGSLTALREEVQVQNMVNVNTRTFIYFAKFFSSISQVLFRKVFWVLFRKVIPSDSTLHFSKFSISQTEDILQVLLFRQVLRREKPVCKIVKSAKSKTCKMSSVCEIGSTQCWYSFIITKITIVLSNDFFIGGTDQTGTHEWCTT